MTKSEYALMKERKWLEEDENACTKMRKQIGEGKNVGYPDRYFLERLGYIYSEQERLQLFEDEYDGKNSNTSTETRIDIPKGYGRFWFEKNYDEDGHVKAVKFVIGRSRSYAQPASETEDDAEVICSLDVTDKKSVIHIAEKFIELATWMEGEEHAEQEGNGAGYDLAPKQNGRKRLIGRGKRRGLLQCNS